MNVLLTGATGYVGARVARRLAARGDRVTGVVRNAERAAALPPGTAPLVADLADPAALPRLVDAALAADAVVHTGFASHGTGWADAVALERALVGAWARALAGSGRRLVVSNGTAFYGDAGGRLLDETAPVRAEHPGAARAAATAPATTTPGVHGVELRLASFVYGDGGSVFLPLLVGLARRTGRSVYVGDGTNRVSAVHVEAAADAYVLALDRGGPGEVHHVASDDAPAMRELAEAVALGTGAVAESVAADEAAALLDPFTAMFLALDNGLSSRKARCALGWSPAGWPPLLWDVAHGSYATRGRDEGPVPR